MFDMTFFCPRDWHLGLKNLAGVEWFSKGPATHLPDGQDASTFTIDWAAVERHAGPYIAEIISEGLRHVDSAYGGGSGTITMLLRTLSDCLGVGPKLLTLDAETCRALADTEVKVEVAEYEQPYEAMIVRFPEEWAREVSAEYGAPPVAVALLGHDRTHQRVTINLYGAGGVRGGVDILFTTRHAAGKTIEDRLERDRTDPDSPPDYRAAVLFERVAFNVGMLATMAGVKSAGWLDPGQRAKHEKLARKEDGRGARLAAGDVERIVFEQDIHLVLGVDVRDRTPYQGGTHDSPHPHWRRRHWRMQPVGPGRSQLRRTIVKRTFVRARALPDGTSPSDVQANYDAEMPEEGEDAAGRG